MPLKHLKETKLGYFRHMRQALKMGFGMIGSGFLCLIHAVFPFWFCSAASKVVVRIAVRLPTKIYDKLSKKIAERRFEKIINAEIATIDRMKELAFGDSRSHPKRIRKIGAQYALETNYLGRHSKALRAAERAQNIGNIIEFENNRARLEREAAEEVIRRDEARRKAEQIVFLHEAEDDE